MNSIESQAKPKNQKMKYSIMKRELGEGLSYAKFIKRYNLVKMNFSMIAEN